MPAGCTTQVLYSAARLDTTRKSRQEHYPIIEMAAPKDVNSAHELICRIAESLRQVRAAWSEAKELKAGSDPRCDCASLLTDPCAYCPSPLLVRPQGEVVIMHCRGGVGRAGLMAACVLLRLGLVRTGDEAIAEASRAQNATPG